MVLRRLRSMKKQLCWVNSAWKIANVFRTFLLFVAFLQIAVFALQMHSLSLLKLP